MFKIIQQLSLIQLFTLFAFIIGFLVIFFVLINVFFWFIIFVFAISFCLRQFNKFKNKNNYSPKDKEDYLVTEYIHIKKNDD